MTEHVLDDLELYAVGALEPAEAERVGAHLAACPSCRLAAEDLARIVSTLPDTLPAREPAPGLRERILATAADEVAGRPRPARRRVPRPGRRSLVLGLVAAVLLLLVLDVSALNRANQEAVDRGQVERQLAQNVGSGRSWYMAGKDEFVGAGGSIKVKSDGSAFVLFHDLPATKALTVWFVSADNRWVRAADFTATGQKLQTVDLQTPASGFERCAVTLGTDTGRPGRTVMESRISAPN